MKRYGDETEETTMTLTEAETEKDRKKDTTKKEKELVTRDDVYNTCK